MPKRNFDPRSHVGETHGIYTIIDVLYEKDQYGRYICSIYSVYMN